MAIPIDVSHAFRFSAELIKLVRAVEAAGAADEGRWIEWKETLDLQKTPSIDHIAKHILGFANRDPRTAASWAEGYGYLIVGAEPANIAGVVPLDPGDLVSKVRPYVGDLITWHPEYVALDGKNVLVIAVEPPRPGDHIHPLRKQLQNFQPGVLFVRYPGQTVQARPEDVAMLERRAQASTTFLELAVRAGQTEVEVAPDLQTQIEAKYEELRAGLLAPRATPAPISAAHSAMGYRPDTRTRTAYELEVADFLSRWVSVMRERHAILVARHVSACLDVHIVNDTDRNFTSVEVSAQVGNADVVDPEGIEEWPALPDVPRPHGEVWLAGFGVPNLGVAGLLMTPRQIFRKFHVESLAGGVHVSYAAFDLRPRESRRLPLVPVGIRGGGPDGKVNIDWSATASNVDGRVEGRISLDTRPSTLDLSSLFDETAPFQ